ncbi:MAG: hypothetical protein E7668_06655 [Ruminococcaceae bacterium]|nr:hypothetical protein [Oscillospiraceae bacterium]
MAGKKNVTKILVSIIFIAYGISSVFDAFAALLELDLGGVLGCALGLLMFVTGIFGFFKNQITVCRVLGVIICLLSALSFALSLAGGAFAVQALVQALLAWIYFDCT